MNTSRTSKTPLSAVLLLLTSCSAPLEGLCENELSSAEQSTDSQWLRLSAAQRSAIALLSIEPDGVPYCTATVIGPELAVTADHCFDANTMTVFSEGDGRAIPIVDWVSHPIYDLALLRFASGDLPEEILPLAPLSELTDGALESTQVEVAGYGVNEEGTVGQLKFSVQQVVEVEDELGIVLDSMGAWLACAGDSGGPLLMRDEMGAVRIAGILSTGALDCMGQGRYLYLPAFADWLTDSGSSPDTIESPCGGLTEAGRCFEQGPVWCDDGALKTDICTPEEQCGYDDELDGYRCVTADRDLCSGTGEQGRCQDGVAIRCVDGVLREDDCTACGGSCGRSPATGLFECRRE